MFSQGCGNVCGRRLAIFSVGLLLAWPGTLTSKAQQIMPPASPIPGADPQAGQPIPQATYQPVPEGTYAPEGTYVPEGTAAPIPRPSPLNALTVDVEEHFQVSAFDAIVDRDQWKADASDWSRFHLAGNLYQ